MSKRNAEKEISAALPDLKRDFEQIPFSVEDDVPVDEDLKMVWRTKLWARRTARVAREMLAHERSDGVTAQYDDYAGAIAELDKEVSSSPHDAGRLMRRGDLHMAAGEYQLAGQDYINVMLAQAGTYVDGGNYTRALNLYSKALELAPDAAGVYANRSVSYIRSGEYEQAIKDLNRAIQLTPAHQR